MLTCSVRKSDSACGLSTRCTKLSCAVVLGIKDALVASSSCTFTFCPPTEALKISSNRVQTLSVATFVEGAVLEAVTVIGFLEGESSLWEGIGKRRSSVVVKIAYTHHLPCVNPPACFDCRARAAPLGVSARIVLPRTRTPASVGHAREWSVKCVCVCVCVLDIILVSPHAIFEHAMCKPRPMPSHSDLIGALQNTLHKYSLSEKFSKPSPAYHPRLHSQWTCASYQNSCCGRSRDGTDQCCEVPDQDHTKLR